MAELVFDTPLLDGSYVLDIPTELQIVGVGIYGELIKASDVNLVLGVASNAPFSMGSEESRNLAKVPTGKISFSDYWPDP